MKTLAIRSDIPLIYTENINGPEFLEKLRGVKPDVIINLGNQIFRKELLSIPNSGCINKHCALLPLYKGINPTLWAMADNQPTVGVTVHFMAEKLDSGDIISQASFNLEEGVRVAEWLM